MSAHRPVARPSSIFDQTPTMEPLENRVLFSGTAAELAFGDNIRGGMFFDAQRGLNAEAGINIGFNTGGVTGGFTPGGSPVDTETAVELAAGDFDAFSAGPPTAGGVFRDANNDVGYFDDGDLIRFDGVDFGAGVDRVTVELASDAALQGGRFELRLGGATGRLIGTVDPRPTGGFSDYQRQTTVLDGTVSGVQDLFVVGRGGEGLGNLRALRFDALARTGGVTPPPTNPTAGDIVNGAPFSSTPVRLTTAEIDFSGDNLRAGGVRVLTDGNIGFFDAGDFIRFSNVDFGFGFDRLTVEAALGQSRSAGSLEFRLGSPTGTRVGTLTPEPTGGYSRYRAQSIVLNRVVQGQQDLFVVGTGGVGIANPRALDFSRGLTGGASQSSVRPATFRAADFDDLGVRRGFGGGPRVLDSGDIGFLDRGGFVGFNGVNLSRGGISTVDRLDLEIATDRALGGGRLEVRLDRPDGRVLGSFTPERGDGFDRYGVQTVTLQNVPSGGGVRSVYLVGESGVAIGNLRSLRFYNAGLGR